MSIEQRKHIQCLKENFPQLRKYSFQNHSLQIDPPKNIIYQNVTRQNVYQVNVRLS